MKNTIIFALICAAWGGFNVQAVSSTVSSDIGPGSIITTNIKNSILDFIWNSHPDSKKRAGSRARETFNKCDDNTVTALSYARNNNWTIKDFVLYQLKLNEKFNSGDKKNDDSSNKQNIIADIRNYNRNRPDNYKDFEKNKAFDACIDDETQQKCSAEYFHDMIIKHKMCNSATDGHLKLLQDFTHTSYLNDPQRRGQTE